MSGSGPDEQLPRDVTLTTRVTRAERDYVARQAAAAGVDASEFVRRSVFDEAIRIEAALAAARERGRVDAQAVAQTASADLRAQLANAQKTARDQRDRASTAEYQVRRHEGLGRFVAAVRDVLSGVEEAKVTVGSTWAALSLRDRDRLMPVVVMLAHDAVSELASARAVETGGGRATWLREAPPVLARAEWLIQNVNPHTGSGLTLRPAREWSGVRDEITAAKKVVTALRGANDASPGSRLS